MASSGDLHDGDDLVGVGGHGILSHVRTNSRICLSLLLSCGDMCYRCLKAYVSVHLLLVLILVPVIYQLSHNCAFFFFF